MVCLPLAVVVTLTSLPVSLLPAADTMLCPLPAGRSAVLGPLFANRSNLDCLVIVAMHPAAKSQFWILSRLLHCSASLMLSASVLAVTASAEQPAIEPRLLPSASA